MLKIKKNFPCDSCGKCCQKVNMSEETAHFDRGDGVCLAFDPVKNQCRIYDIRPLICRVDAQYELNYKLFYTWDEFVALNQQACQQLKEI